MRSFIFFCILALVSCDTLLNDDHRNTDKYHTVTKVIDGDTFWVQRAPDISFKVRLIGIDAPETRKTRYKEKGFYGQQSKEYLENLIDKQEVKLVIDVDSLDRYGRTLAYAYLPDGTMINAKLIKGGYATVMTVPPNIQHSELFLELQKHAQHNKTGLWSVDPLR